MERLNRKYARENGLCGSYYEYPVRILQFGEGNFLRAFIDYMTDVMNEKGVFEGSVLLVQPTPHGIVEKQREQDFLYTVIERGISGGQPVNNARIISSIRDGIDPYRNPAKFLESAAIPTIELVFSNTTEAGLVYTPTEYVPGTMPEAFPAKLCIWLYERWKHFGNQFAPEIVPCELVDKGGDKLKEYLLRHAADFGFEVGFADYINNCCRFVNTLVDRIVTGYPKTELPELPYEDKFTDTCEPFLFFAMENGIPGLFPAARAGFDAVCADDISVYPTRKVRLLNGAHTSMVPVGRLSGIETVRETLEDEATGRFVRSLIDEELLPLCPVADELKKPFADAVTDRFLNPNIRHELSAIALQTSSKLVTRLLPTIEDGIRLNGEPPRLCCLAFAANLAMLMDEGLRPRDSEAAIAMAQRLCDSYAAEPYAAVSAALADTAVWGKDLNSLPGFTAAVAYRLDLIQKLGMLDALRLESDR